MCFSASASFLAAGVIGIIGVATLRHVREPRALLFAAVPLLFALHQATEGLVWLGLDGRIGPLALDHVAFLFMVYAMGVLPVLLPAAVALLEPPGRRHHAILALTAVGALVSAWDIYGLVVFPSQCFAENHSVAYRNPMTGNFAISCLYIVATCGALLLSTHRVVRWYGVLNVIGVTIAEIRQGVRLRLGLVLLRRDAERGDLLAVPRAEHRHRDAQRRVGGAEAVPAAVAAAG